MCNVGCEQAVLEMTGRLGTNQLEPCWQGRGSVCVVIFESWAGLVGSRVQRTLPLAWRLAVVGELARVGGLVCMHAENRDSLT